MARLRFAYAMLRTSPPWLRRTIGGPVVEAIGDMLDTLVDRTTEGVRKRFPAGDDDAAMSYIGRERRIRRGPGEDGTTYAARLATWWDAHRNRGGPYALLTQLFLFWRRALNVPMEVVYYSGTRRSVDVDGVITRDAITWTADASGEWAKIWVFFHLDADVVGDLPGSHLVTELGHVLVDEEGDILSTGGELPLPDDLISEFRLIPTDWNAAHVKTTTIVLFYGDGALWDYPQPIPTWDADSSGGETWDEELPIEIVVEG